MKQTDISLIEQDLATPKRLAQVRQWLLEYAGCTLLQFAYLVCMRFRLVNEAGKLRDHTCARALEELDRKGLICLADSLKLKAPVKKAPAPENFPLEVETRGYYERILIATVFYCRIICFGSDKSRPNSFVGILLYAGDREAFARATGV